MGWMTGPTASVISVVEHQDLGNQCLGRRAPFYERL